MSLPATSAPAKQSNLSRLVFLGAGSNYTDLGPAGEAGMGVKRGMDISPAVCSLALLRQVGLHCLFTLWIPDAVFQVIIIQCVLKHMPCCSCSTSLDCIHYPMW